MQRSGDQGQERGHRNQRDPLCRGHITHRQESKFRPKCSGRIFDLGSLEHSLATTLGIHQRGTREDSGGPLRRPWESSGRCPGPGGHSEGGRWKRLTYRASQCSAGILWDHLIPSLLHLMPFWTTHHQPEALASPPSLPRTKSHGVITCVFHGSSRS